MISIKPVVHQHRRRRDGTWPVTIRVTFGRKCRYLPTTITVTAADMTRSLKIKNPEVIARTNEICDRLRNEAAALNPFELEGRDVDWVVARLRDSMRAQDFRLDFFRWADTFLQEKTAGNRTKYETALRAFARYLGRHTIDVNEITHALLVDFAEKTDSGTKMSYCRRTDSVKPTAIPRTRKVSPEYLSHLAHIYDAAKDRYNDEDGGAVVIPRSPFRNLNMTPPTPTTGQKAQPVAVLQAMIDDHTASPSVRRSLDVFIVGFALMGANLADLWEARPPKGGWWGYNRRKTAARRADGAFILCAVPREIGPFLARLGAGTSASCWLPVLRALGKNSSIAGQTVNRGLRTWCEDHGVAPFTYYACRKSWATLARSRAVAIEKATVDEGLGHVGDYRVADIYAERDWERIAEANRRVLALLRWPE